jgi:hypothetical protein
MSSFGRRLVEMEWEKAGGESGEIEEAREARTAVLEGRQLSKGTEEKDTRGASQEKGGGREIRKEQLARRKVEGER